MLRGIPVVASDAGGLVEAKLGTDFVIPVRSIEHYEAMFDVMVRWARFGNLFAYEDDADRLALQ